MKYFVSTVRLADGDDSDAPNVCLVELTEENLQSLVAMQKAAVSAKDLCPKPQDFQYLSIRIDFAKFVDVPEDIYEKHLDFINRIENEEGFFVTPEELPEDLKTLAPARFTELDTVCVWCDGSIYFRCYGKYNGTTFESVDLVIEKESTEHVNENIILIPV